MANKVFYPVLVFIYVFLSVLSCGDGNYGGDATSTSTSGSSTASGVGAPVDSCGGGEWGGVTCKSGSNLDEHFGNFVSNRVDIMNYNNLRAGKPKNPSFPGIEEISCQPSPNQGILFKMNVILNGDLSATENDPSRILNMQPGSTLTIEVRDKLLERYNSGEIQLREPPQAISFQFNGSLGDITGNNVNLVFTHQDSQWGQKTVTFKGQISGSNMTGDITYTNTVKRDRNNSVPGGASGVLGSFSICTSKAFTSGSL